jgi:hypothetical protein
MKNLTKLSAYDQAKLMALMHAKEKLNAAFIALYNEKLSAIYINEVEKVDQKFENELTLTQRFCAIERIIFKLIVAKGGFKKSDILKYYQDMCDENDLLENDYTNINEAHNGSFNSSFNALSKNSSEKYVNNVNSSNNVKG